MEQRGTSPKKHDEESWEQKIVQNDTDLRDGDPYLGINSRVAKK